MSCVVPKCQSNWLSLDVSGKTIVFLILGWANTFTHLNFSDPSHKAPNNELWWIKVLFGCESCLGLISLVRLKCRCFFYNICMTNNRLGAILLNRFVLSLQTNSYWLNQYVLFDFCKIKKFSFFKGNFFYSLSWNLKTHFPNAIPCILISIGT